MVFARLSLAMPAAKRMAFTMQRGQPIVGHVRPPSSEAGTAFLRLRSATRGVFGGLRDVVTEPLGGHVCSSP